MENYKEFDFFYSISKNIKKWIIYIIDINLDIN